MYLGDREHRDTYDDVDFRSRYQLRRDTVMNIIEGIRDDILDEKKLARVNRGFFTLIIFHM